MQIVLNLFLNLNSQAERAKGLMQAKMLAKQEKTMAGQDNFFELLQKRSEQAGRILILGEWEFKHFTLTNLQNQSACGNKLGCSTEITASHKSWGDYCMLMMQ